MLVLLMDETLWSLMTEEKDIMCNVFARPTSLLPPQLLAADAQLTPPPPNFVRFCSEASITIHTIGSPLHSSDILFTVRDPRGKDQKQPKKSFNWTAMLLQRSLS